MDNIKTLSARPTKAYIESIGAMAIAQSNQTFRKPNVHSVVDNLDATAIVDFMNNWIGEHESKFIVVESNEGIQIVIEWAFVEFKSVWLSGSDAVKFTAIAENENKLNAMPLYHFNMIDSEGNSEKWKVKAKTLDCAKVLANEHMSQLNDIFNWECLNETI